MRIFFKVLSTLLILFLISSCDEDKQVMVTGSDPEIIEIKVNQSWNLNRTEPYTVEVKVDDPQGPRTLEPVVVSVENEMGQPVYTGTLYDDGAVQNPEAGDVLAGDGVFRNRIKVADITTESGMFSLTIDAKDNEGNNAAPQTIDVRISNNQAPEIVALSVDESLPSGTEASYIYATITDPDGIEEVKSVNVEILTNPDLVKVNEFVLFNDGDFDKHGDHFASDSIHSYKMDSTFSAGLFGTYTLNFIVSDEFDDTGNPQSTNIFLENIPGYIPETSMPDSVERPLLDAVAFASRARVIDPQGLADIDSVYFTLQDSKGVYVADNFGNITKILLADDGDLEGKGDEVAGDGIFSVILQINSNNILETYTIRFYSRDLVGNLSQPAFHQFTIY